MDRNIIMGLILTLIVSSLPRQMVSQEMLYFDSLSIADATLHNLRKINSSELDFSPVIWSDLLVYVTNGRSDLDVDKRIGEKFFDLKFADWNGVDDFERSAFFPSIINSKYHEGPCTFSPDGGVMLFTRDYLVRGRPIKTKDNIIPLKIYQSVLNASGWSDPVLWQHNDINALDAHPSLSITGDTLAFSSNREGGHGKMDLYLSFKESGQWTVPVSIGDDINTEGNEWFGQFYQGYLIYASDSASRAGDLDLYLYNFTTKESIRLPAPINSSYDDFGLAMLDRSSLVFTSNRPGGEGKDDLYQMTTPVPFIREGDFVPNFLTLDVKDAKTLSKVQGAEFEVFVISDKDKIIEMLINGSNAEQLLESNFESKLQLTSDPSGNLELEIKPPVFIKVVGQNAGYQDFVWSEYVEEGSLNQSIILYPEKVITKVVTPPPPPPKKKVIIKKQEVKKGSILVFDNIYYAYNQHKLQEGSLSELQELAYAMNSNPTIKVQLSAHTDSRGESLYNQLLSDKRAQSAKDYLISLGVNATRIVAIGFGESRLRNQCDDGVICTDEEHQFNRRTEVKILDY